MTILKKVIKTQGLSKKFGNKYAVNDVSLSINQGEIYGFLGLNGAGKTTTILMLLGMVTPTFGNCYINNTEVKTNKIKLWNDIGYMVETPYAYPELTVRDNLEIFYKLRNLSSIETVDEVMDLLNIKQYENVKVKNLSMGNSQRLGIAKALIHKPKILILDEPTNGLDPTGIVEIRKLFKRLSEENKVTILISSHKLDEISKIASKIGIIHNGKLIREIACINLDRHLKKTLYIGGHNIKKMHKLLKEKGYSILIHEESQLIKTTDINIIDNPEEIVTILVENNYPPNLINIEKENLEDYFLRILYEDKEKNI